MRSQLRAWTGERQITIAAIAIAIIGFLFQRGLQLAMRPYAIDGVYFQQWSSEEMMQTVSIQDLRDAPLESLFHIHIQPPLMDALRAILVQFAWSADIHKALIEVDQMLYVVWGILYGLLGAIVFVWLAKLTDQITAFFFTILFLLHPAVVFYATLLDSTFLSAFLIACLYYLLWRIKENPSAGIGIISLTVLALFFTRSIFQWQAMLLIGFSLLLLKVPVRKVLIFLLITGGISTLYLAKQYQQFGIFSTSSFSGMNLTRSVNIDIGYDKFFKDYSSKLESGPVTVLSRKAKLDDVVNFNNSAFLTLNQTLLARYNKYMSTWPVPKLWKSYKHNLYLYFRPSSNYNGEKNVIVDQLPWRGLYDSIFSYPILLILLLICGGYSLTRILKEKTFLQTLGLFLPGLYVFVASVLFEQGENMRLKFFLEPVMYVFMVSVFYGLSQWAYQKIKRK